VNCKLQSLKMDLLIVVPHTGIDEQHFVLLLFLKAGVIMCKHLTRNAK